MFELWDGYIVEGNINILWELNLFGLTIQEIMLEQRYWQFMVWIGDRKVGARGNTLIESIQRTIDLYKSGKSIQHK